MTKLPEKLEQNYELLEYLAQQHISNFSVRTPLTAIIGYSQILLNELEGTLTRRQEEVLESINFHAEELLEYINVFLDATPFIFGKKELYPKDVDLLQIISDFVSQIQEKTRFQIQQDIPANMPTIKADEGEIYKALYSILGIIKQIHPTNEGRIMLSVGHEEYFVTMGISTEKEEPLRSEANPELFIAQSIAELHGGKLQIESDNDCWNFSFILPIPS